MNERVEGASRLSVRKMYKLFIDGKFTRSESEHSFRVCGVHGEFVAMTSRASRKDLKHAVVAARSACSPWRARSAYQRGQILYRMAEMLERRSQEFLVELASLGVSYSDALEEVDRAIDRLVYYAGWTDKFSQILSSCNPVGSGHLSVSIPEPMGVIAVICSDEWPLLAPVTGIAAAIAGGNSVVILASERHPLSALTLAEVVHTGDVPAGVVNILSGIRAEIVPHLARHLDVNGMVWISPSEGDEPLVCAMQREAAEGIRRTFVWSERSLASPYYESLSRVGDLQEIKTVWHPVAI
jgi:acyl-CoA reductase-like NAD-dependent aldehyde dehydrogenase